MKTFGNIIKIIVSVIIITLIVLGVVIIVKNVSALSAAFEGTKQTVIDSTAKNNINQPEEISTVIREIVF